MCHEKEFPKRRTYDASGRQAQARETREAIVAAAIARLRRVRPEDLTYADVADDAGIALRTVYRHFPTPQDLFAAALDRFLGDTVGSSTLEGKSRTELVEVLERVHARLSAEPGLYRLFFALPARSGVGMAAVVKAVCADALARIPESASRRSLRRDRADARPLRLGDVPHALECPAGAHDAGRARVGAGDAGPLRRAPRAARSRRRAPPDVPRSAPNVA